MHQSSLGFYVSGSTGWNSVDICSSELWVAGQNAAPDWARGRMNAVYMMLSNGSTAIGGIVWGAAATFYGLNWALHGASILLLFSLPLLFRLSIDFVHELSHQQSPFNLDSHDALEVPDPEEGPVEVTMGFQIEPSKRDQFLNLLQMRDIYLHNGVSSFRVYEDLARKHSFRVPSDVGRPSIQSIGAVALHLNRRLRSQAIHDLNAVNVALKS